MDISICKGFFLQILHNPCLDLKQVGFEASAVAISFLESLRIPCESTEDGLKCAVSHIKSVPIEMHGL